MIDARFFATVFHGIGEMNIIPISLFKRNNSDGILSRYRRGMRPIEIIRKKRGINVSMYCDGCQQYTTYQFSLRDLCRKGGNYLYCDNCSIDLGFIGNREDVEKVALKHKKKVEFLIKEMGFDSFFKNPLIVYELINYIHYMVENKKIICECGSVDIKTNVNFDKIELLCEKCESRLVIDAKNRKDLEKIKQGNSIVITQ